MLARVYHLFGIRASDNLYPTGGENYDDDNWVDRGRYPPPARPPPAPRPPPHARRLSRLPVRYELVVESESVPTPG